MNDALLPGEKLLATRPANLMFGFDVDVKLPTTTAGALTVLVELAPKIVKMRALAGKVHVTNYRLYFATHRLNTTRGTCSIFHPTIVYDEPVTGVFAGQWIVKTRTASHRFAVRDPKELSALLRQTRTQELDVEALKGHVKGALEKVSSGISVLWDNKDLAKILEAKNASSIQIVGLMNAHELFTGP